MYKVKYYQKDQYIGEEKFSTLEKAEIDLYKSPYSFVGDFYEIIDQSTSRIVHEFTIPSYDLPLYDGLEKIWDKKPECLDWFD